MAGRSLVPGPSSSRSADRVGWRKTTQETRETWEMCPPTPPRTAGGNTKGQGCCGKRPGDSWPVKQATATGPASPVPGDSGRGGCPCSPAHGASFTEVTATDRGQTKVADTRSALKRKGVLTSASTRMHLRTSRSRSPASYRHTDPVGASSVGSVEEASPGDREEMEALELGEGA